MARIPVFHPWREVGRGAGTQEIASNSFSLSALGKARLLRTAQPLLRECNRSQRDSQAARYLLPGLDCIFPGRVSNLCVWLKYSESTVTRDLRPGSLQSRDGAWARGWSILNSNWLEASWFITGKERPGTYSDLELFHCSFPGAGSPPPPPRSVPGGEWGVRRDCMVMVHRAGMSIERITVLPTPSASSTSWARIRQNVSYRPALRASGERLDEAQLRDAKNLKDAVIATPFPLAVRGRSGPSQADPDTSPFGSGKGGEGNKHRATHDSGRAGLRARAAPYHWAATQGKFCFVFPGRGRG